MNRVEKVTIGETEIIKIDYTDCKQDEMIELIKTTKEIILNDNKSVLVLSIFNKRNYLTPVFMRQFEKDYKDVEELIAKNAVIGLSNTQKWILKGVNMWTKKEINYFNSMEEAIQFLQGK